MQFGSPGDARARKLIICFKKQIYLHHTAGGPSAVSVARFFNNKEGKIATAFIIGAKIFMNLSKN